MMFVIILSVLNGMQSYKYYWDIRKNEKLSVLDCQLPVLIPCTFPLSLKVRIERSWSGRLSVCYRNLFLKKWLRL